MVRRGALGFSVLRIRPIFRSVFRFSLTKIAVFRFWYLLQFADFAFFYQLVFGFRQKYKRFFGFGSNSGFRFLSIGFRFLFSNFDLDYAPLNCVLRLSPRFSPAFPLFCFCDSENLMVTIFGAVLRFLIGPNASLGKLLPSPPPLPAFKSLTN